MISHLVFLFIVEELHHVGMGAGCLQLTVVQDLLTLFLLFGVFQIHFLALSLD